MNTKMLQYLVELSGSKVEPIDTNAFFSRFPRETYSDELYSLQKLGFISLLSGDNQIIDIGVNQKAIDYISQL